MNRKTQLGRSCFAAIIALMFLSVTFMSLVSIGMSQLGLPETAAPPGTEDKVMADIQTEIENLLWNIDEDLVAEYVQTLQDFGTRYSYAVEKNFQASEYIYSVFESNGLATYFDGFSFNRFDMRNVVAELTGTLYPDEIYIICGHFDSISPQPYINAPGADDNGSGTAAVMAAAEILSDYSFNYTIRFIAFSCEEQGLRGSRYYAEQANLSGENILGVLNLDMMAYNPDTEVNVRMRTNTNSESLADAVLAYYQKYQDIIGFGLVKSIDASANSDHAAFWQYGYKAIHYLEQNYSLNPNYHKVTDTIDNMNLTACANVTQMAIAALAELAELNTADTVPPIHTHEFPTPNGFGNATPVMSVEITDPSLVDLATIKLYIDGFSVFYDLAAIPTGFNVSYYHSSGFSDGQIIDCRVVANDTVGNMLDYTWSFTVDAIAPDPPDDFNIDLVRIHGMKQGLAIDIGGPNDGLHAQAPSVIYQDGEYKMWYGGANTGSFQILYATSVDGITWVKQGVAISRGSSGQPDDAHANYPSVIYDGTYKMWYSAYDGALWRIMYATSNDGISWNKQGVVLDIGANGEYDDMHALKPSVVKTTEYEMWYTGIDGIKYNIVYANSTDGISWNKLGSVVFNHSEDGAYDDIDANDPCVVYDGQYHMWYTGSNGHNGRVMYANSSDGLTWDRQGLVVDIGSSGYDTVNAYIPAALFKDGETKIWYTGYVGNFRILYANISDGMSKPDIAMSWSDSVSPDVVRYDLYRANDPTELVSQTDRFMMVNNSFTDRWGYDNGNYYYMVKAIDRAGNIGESVIVGKIGLGVVNGWNLISTPFPAGPTALDEVLPTLNWISAQYYDAIDTADHWKTYVENRPPILNDLQDVDNTMALWVSVEGADVFATVGEVVDISIDLEAGWNFVSYPHHKEMMVQDALIGVPYDMVEEFDSGEPYRIKTMLDTDIMRPGGGYWIRATSAFTWNVINA